jgi:hypothetical protein
VPAEKWLECWTTNRSTILFLALINTSLTTGSEIASRSVIAAISQRHQDGFLVKTATGRERIHRQSAINIVMTLLATLLGGPIYFITRRLHRFIFFITFGIFNSVLAQSFTSIFIEGLFLIVGRRLFFDFAYNASIKFLLFEFVRPYLLKHRQSAFKVTLLRVSQDFITTSFRVVILNILKLSGH